MMELNQDTANELLAYDAETGALYWKPRARTWFNSNAAAWAFAKRCAGKRAFTAVDSHGYQVGMILQKRMTAHRLIWLMMTGEQPSQIDHINGDRKDNRFENLRAVTNLENARNRKIAKRNTTGVMGVCWYKPTQRWHARIKVPGKDIHLGYFVSKDDATAARKSAEQRYGFHANNGRASI